MRGAEVRGSDHLHPVREELAGRWTWSRLAGVAAAVTAFAGGCSLVGVPPRSLGGVAGVPSLTSATEAHVVVNADVTHQVMQGFGASHRNWDDPHVSEARQTSIPLSAQREILTRLYTDLGLSRVRAHTERGLEPVNDNTDPFTFDWSKFDFRGRRNDANVEFVNQAMPYGLRTVWVSPSPLEDWLNESNPEEYAEWALAILLRWRHLAVELPFYSITNEPGHDASRFRSVTWFKDAVKALGRRMRAEGLRTMLVIPDDLNPTEAYRRAAPVLEDPEARSYVGALAYHLYGGHEHDLSRMRDLSLRYGIPLWMSEFSHRDYATYSGAMGWARTVHELIARYRVSAVDYMFGFFGAWEDHGAHSLVNVDFDAGAYRGYQLTPAYYLTGQYSRHVRPGYVRVDAHSQTRGILVTAFKGPDSLVVVAINSTHQAEQVAVSLTGVPPLASISLTRTSRDESWKALPAVSPARLRFTVSLPAESVTTIVGHFAKDRSAGAEDPVRKDTNGLR